MVVVQRFPKFHTARQKFLNAWRANKLDRYVTVDAAEGGMGCSVA